MTFHAPPLPERLQCSVKCRGLFAARLQVRLSPVFVSASRCTEKTRVAVDMDFNIHIHIHIHRFYVDIHGYIHIHRCLSCIHVSTEYPIKHSWFIYAWFIYTFTSSLVLNNKNYKQNGGVR